jgi:hypothetical protein
VKQFARPLAAGVLGAFVGFTFATLVLFPQIARREGLGKSEGFSRGASHVVDFIEKNLRPNEGRAGRDLGIALNLRDTRLSVVDIDGVRTLRVDR